jgi:integrase
VFPNARGGQLSAHGVHYLLAKHVAVAARTCPSLGKKRVSPHVLRHAAAMDLLQQGIDLSVIALWLGHESIETTQIYLDADLELKQRVLDAVAPPNGKPGRYRPTTSFSHFSVASDNTDYVPLRYHLRRTRAMPGSGGT